MVWDDVGAVNGQEVHLGLEDITAAYRQSGICDPSQDKCAAVPTVQKETRAILEAANTAPDAASRTDSEMRALKGEMASLTAIRPSRLAVSPFI